MNPDDLIDGYLDDRLDPSQLQALSDWIKADPEHAQRFAQSLLLHDRLRDGFQSAAPPVASPRRLVWRVPRTVVMLAAAAGIVLACLAILLNVGTQRVDAAEAQLERLIAAADRLSDRTYRITALDAGSSDAAGERPPGRNRPAIDGALLHVRGHGLYVLVRRPETPEAFVTGCDGREAWSIAPDGPVRVSTDLSRFRGAVPGEQQGLPFLDLKSALDRLRTAYALELEGEPASPARRLRAHKRSPSHRGPRDVTVTFDARSGVILSMRLDGLPQAQGGPRSVSLVLIDQADLGPDFFSHQAHHSPDRRVIREGQWSPRGSHETIPARPILHARGRLVADLPLRRNPRPGARRPTPRRRAEEEGEARRRPQAVDVRHGEGQRLR